MKIVSKPSYTKEVEGRVVATTGESIRFVDGIFETEDENVIEFLRARPETKEGIIIEVPENVKNLVKEREEWMKDLETREAELKAKEAALAEKESKASGAEGGSIASLKRPDLMKLAKEKGVEVKATDKNADIIAKLEAVEKEEGDENGDF